MSPEDTGPPRDRSCHSYTAGHGSQQGGSVGFQARVSAGRGAEPADATAPEIKLDVPNPRAEMTTLATAVTGGHLLHLAVAVCVLNDVYREAQRMGIEIDSVAVTADGAFGGDPVVSTGITYSVDVASPASPDQITRLIAHVDSIAEIPNTLKRVTEVSRV